MKQPSALLTTLRLPRCQVWPARPSVASATSALTCVVDDEARVADRGIAAEGEEEAVAAALDAAWQLGAIEASYQRAERVPSVVDMKEVVAGLQIKAGEQKKKSRPHPTKVKEELVLASAEGQGLPDGKPSNPLALKPQDSRWGGAG